MRESSRPTQSPPGGIQAGADNLLVQCMAVERGDSLLIVTEPPERSFYDPRVAEVVAERSRHVPDQRQSNHPVHRPAANA